MKSHRTYIDGPLVNLCHAQGIDLEPAIDLLATILRIHLDENSKKRRKMRYTPPTSEIEIMGSEDHRFYKARGRIARIEKAIDKLRRGEEHGLKRKTWRKDKSDSASIMDTFIHVISRRRPETKEDIFADACALLIRTGELIHYEYINQAPPTYEGRPGLNVKITSNEMRIARNHTDAIRIEPSGEGIIRFQFNNEVPDTVYQTISDAVENFAHASDVIDWDALKGHLPARLQNIRLTRTFQSGDEDLQKIELVVNTGYVTMERFSGEVAIHYPGADLRRAA